MPERARPLDRVTAEEPERAATPTAAPPPDRTRELLALQRGAGNAAVSRLLTTGAPAAVARWSYLGEEAWTIPAFTRRRMKVWTATKDEWKRMLANMDDEDEYKEHIWGFLTVANDPGIVGRTRPPRHISSDAESVKYENTIDRAPTQAEKLVFMEALYESGDELDLWHGGTWEGGPFSRFADLDLSTFVASNQDLYLLAMAQQGRPISSKNTEALATQGGKQVTMAMITNAGATAHKGVDLLVAASRKEEGTPREVAHAAAYELIRNSGRTIAAALKAHDARVQFEQGVVAAVFDHVWGLIPGGGQIASAGKAVLKYGLGEALKKASTDDGPGDQAESINAEFVVTCNKLVQTGEMKSAEMQDAINGFEAVRK